MPNNIPDGQLPSSEEMMFRTFTAEKIGVYVRGQFTEYPGLADNMKFSFAKHPAIDNMIATIQSWMLAGRVPIDDHYDTVKWPDGAWQMFKEKHLPHWFKNKFPVRWHEERIKISSSVVFACPHLSTDEPSAHVKFMAIGTDMARGFRSRGY